MRHAIKINRYEKRQFAHGLIVLLSAVTLAGCAKVPSGQVGASNPGVSEPRRELIIFAAASTTNAVTDITTDFAEECPLAITTNFGSSSTLARQIESGADADLFLSANQKWADHLEEQGLVEFRKDLLRNSLVVIAPRGSDLRINSLYGLLQVKVRQIAIGDPNGVPAGIYAKEALEHLDLLQKIESKLVAAKDVRAALAYVETGAAEAGIVYATDAAISDRIQVVYHIPREYASEILYPILVLKNANHPDGARQIIDYLDKASAAEIFNRYGFTPLMNVSAPVAESTAAERVVAERPGESRQEVIN